MDGKHLNRAQRRALDKMRRTQSSSLRSVDDTLEQYSALAKHDIVEQFPLTKKIRSLYTTELPSGHAVTQIVDDLHNRYVTSSHPRKGIKETLDIITVLKAIDKEQFSVKGQRIGEYVQSILTHALWQRLMLTWCEAPDCTEEVLNGLIADISGQDSESDAYLASMTESLTAFRQARAFAHLTHALVSNRDSHPDRNTESVAHLNGGIVSAIGKSISTNQIINYRSPFLPFPKSSFELSDPRMFRDANAHDISRQVVERNLEGLIFCGLSFDIPAEQNELRYMRSVCSLSPEPQKIKKDGRDVYFMRSMSYSIDKRDGELMVFQYPYQVSLKHFFARQDALYEYELLRGSILQAFARHISVNAHNLAGRQIEALNADYLEPFKTTVRQQSWEACAKTLEAKPLSDTKTVDNNDNWSRGQSRELFRYWEKRDDDTLDQFPFVAAMKRHARGYFSKADCDQLAELVWRKYCKDASLSEALSCIIIISDIYKAISDREHPSPDHYIDRSFIDSLLEYLMRKSNFPTSEMHDLYQILEEYKLPADGTVDNVNTHRLHFFFDQYIFPAFSLAVRGSEWQKHCKETMGSEFEQSRAEFRTMGNELLGAISRFRRYTVAHTYFEDDLFRGENDDVWVVMDRGDFDQNNNLKSAARDTVRDALAIFMIASKKEITGYDVSKTINTRNPLLHIEELSLPFKPIHTITLGKDGELYVGLGKHSLKHLFEKKDLLPTYEMLRLNLISRVYDNVVPREADGIVPAMTSWKYAFEEGGKRGETILETLRKLILPRIKYAQDARKVNHAIEQEEREALRNMKQHESRSKHRFLGRVGYAKPIRPGYHAPEFLREAALKEMDYVLKEGETWVRKSRPGIKLPRIIPDRLFRKQSDDSSND